MPSACGTTYPRLHPPSRSHAHRMDKDKPTQHPGEAPVIKPPPPTPLPSPPPDDGNTEPPGGDANART